MRRLYVADIAAYNQGTAHGAWLTCPVSPEDIKTLLEASPLCNKASKHYDPHHVPEEAVIHGHEGFPEYLLTEFTSIKEANKIAEVLDNFHDEDMLCAYIYVIDLNPNWDEVADKAKAAFLGKYASGAAYAEEYCRDLYYQELDDMPSTLSSHIDWNRIWSSTLQFGVCEHNGYFFDRCLA